jgi:CBS domain-containing protein
MILLNDKWVLRNSKLTIGEYFMNTVRQLLQDRAQEVSCVEPDKTAHDAMQLMADKKIGALPVLEAGKLIGIISERDYPGKAKRLDKPLRDVLVKEIMSTQVIQVSPDDTIEACIALISKNHVRHLPVLENNQIIGIISIGDLSHT